jgi:hypothetical protein
MENAHIGRVRFDNLTELTPALPRGGSMAKNINRYFVVRKERQKY